MKKVLSVLVAFVFLQVQSWALSGGPVFLTDTGSFNGNYAGVLIPEDTNSSLDSSSALTSAVGLFSLTQPETGFATGVTVAFIDGVVYNGTIQGIIDPNGKISGIVDSTGNYVVVSNTPGVDATNIFAQGTITGKVTTDRQAFNLLRLEGESSLDLFSTLTEAGTPDIAKTVHFKVDGFRQSSL